jgi:hypothetical protein
MGQVVDNKDWIKLLGTFFATPQIVEAIVHPGIVNNNINRIKRFNNVVSSPSYRY